MEYLFEKFDFVKNVELEYITARLIPIALSI